MNKLLITTILLSTLLFACKKDNNNSNNNNNSTSSQTKDLDNYFTIDNVTNYRIIIDASNPLNKINCSSTGYFWSNIYPGIQQDNNARINISEYTYDTYTQVSIDVNHIENGLETVYKRVIPYSNLSKITTKKVVNNTTVIEFKNLKIYTQQDLLKNDTTKPYSLTGKITCK